MTNLSTSIRRTLVPKLEQTEVQEWNLTDSDGHDLGDVPSPKPRTRQPQARITAMKRGHAKEWGKHMRETEIDPLLS